MMESEGEEEEQEEEEEEEEDGRVGRGLWLSRGEVARLASSLMGTEAGRAAGAPCRCCIGPLRLARLLLLLLLMLLRSCASGRPYTVLEDRSVT